VICLQLNVTSLVQNLVKIRQLARVMKKYTAVYFFSRHTAHTDDASSRSDVNEMSSGIVNK